MYQLIQVADASGGYPLVRIYLDSHPDDKPKELNKLLSSDRNLFQTIKSVEDLNSIAVGHSVETMMSNMSLANPTRIRESLLLNDPFYWFHTIKSVVCLSVSFVYLSVSFVYLPVSFVNLSASFVYLSVSFVYLPSVFSICPSVLYICPSVSSFCPLVSFICPSVRLSVRMYVYNLIHSRPERNGVGAVEDPEVVAPPRVGSAHLARGHALQLVLPEQGV